MTLAEMRTMFLANVDDVTQTYFTNAMADVWLNAGLRHVCNFADRQAQSLFQYTASASGVGTAPSADSPFVEIPFYSGSPKWNIDPTLRRFRRVLTVSRLGVSGRRVPLQLVDIEERDRHVPSNGTPTPKVYVGEDGIGLIYPSESASYIMLYVYSLPDMLIPTDTPGENNAVGTPNALPVDWHPMIVMYATVLALNSENSDATRWQQLYGEYRDELVSSLVRRRGPRGEAATT